MSDYRPAFEHIIYALRVRKTWTGKLILQVRRRVRKAILMPCRGSSETQWEDCGVGPWRDADGNNTTEVADVVFALTQLSLAAAHNSVNAYKVNADALNNPGRYEIIEGKL